MSLPRRTLKEAAQLHSEHPDVIAASGFAYAHVDLSGGEPEDEMLETHMRGVCYSASEIMVAALGVIGYRAQLFDGSRQNDGKAGGHRYITMPSSRGELVLDPTWVQFFTWGHDAEDYSPAMWRQPRVLVGTRPEVVAYAREAGLAERHLSYWQEGYGAPAESLVEEPVEEVLLEDFAEEYLKS